MLGGRDMVRRLLKGQGPRGEKDDFDAVPALLKLMALEGTCWVGGQRTRDWMLLDLIAAPSTFVAPPSLPQVTAPQGWAGDLSPPHPSMCILLLADITQPMSPQKASPPTRYH